MPVSKQQRTKLNLPKFVVAGDRCRLKADAKPRYRDACIIAGYPMFDPDGIWVAQYTEEISPSLVRVRIDAQPFYINRKDLVPAWDTDQERAIALKKLGWYRNGSGNWIRRLPANIRSVGAKTKQ